MRLRLPRCRASGTVSDLDWGTGWTGRCCKDRAGKASTPFQEFIWFVREAWGGGNPHSSHLRAPPWLCSLSW